MGGPILRAAPFCADLPIKGRQIKSQAQEGAGKRAGRVHPASAAIRKSRGSWNAFLSSNSERQLVLTSLAVRAVIVLAPSRTTQASQLPHAYDAAAAKSLMRRRKTSRVTWAGIGRRTSPGAFVQRQRLSSPPRRTNTS